MSAVAGSPLKRLRQDIDTAEADYAAATIKTNAKRRRLLSLQQELLTEQQQLREQILRNSLPALLVEQLMDAPLCEAELGALRFLAVHDEQVIVQFAAGTQHGCYEPGSVVLPPPGGDLSTMWRHALALNDEHPGHALAAVIFQVLCQPGVNADRSDFLRVYFEQRNKEA